MNDIYSNELGDLLQDTCNKMSMQEPNYTKIKKITNEIRMNTMRKKTFKKKTIKKKTIKNQQPLQTKFKT